MPISPPPLPHGMKPFRFWETDQERERRDARAEQAQREERERRERRERKRQEQEKAKSDEKAGGQRNGPKARDKSMTVPIALELLNIALPFTTKELRAAWKKAIGKAHPDRPGGSNEAAQQVNAAYDYLKSMAKG